MNEILEFLDQSKVFYFATTEDSQPHVRPFGFVMEYSDRLYFGTGDQKPCYRQLKNNPRFELCAYNKEKSTWLRMSGTVEFDHSLETVQHILEHSHFLNKLYGDPNGPQFIPFYVKNGKAMFEKDEGESWSIYI